MKKIGLALGGGAVLGAAHIGVIRAISEFDMEITHISGTSIGALIGALLAFGKDCDEIEDIASELSWMDISAISLSRYGLLSNEKLGNLLIDRLDNKDIEDSNIPIALVATDITNGEKKVMKSGPVSQAVMASTCIPGIFEPVEIDGQMLVDGGISENVPVKTVMEMTDNYIIGVDLNSQHKFEKPGNILEVIVNSFHLLMQKSDRLQSKDADLLIKPDLSEFNRADTSQVKQLIKKGYEDAIKVLRKQFDIEKES